MPDPYQAAIKRFDQSIALPKYQTSGSAGFDLSAREDTVIAPGATVLVPLNVAIQPPKDCWILLAARSSLHKKGLVPINGIGVVDADYSGDTDEYKAALFNITENEVLIEKGERIMQAVVMPLVQVSFEELEVMKNGSRGGFGSTGNK